MATGVPSGRKQAGTPAREGSLRSFFVTRCFLVEAGENTGNGIRHGPIKRNVQLEFGLRFDGTDIVMRSKLTWCDASDLSHCDIVAWVAYQGYRRVSIRCHVREVANFAAWAESVGFGTAPLDPAALSQL